MNFTKDDRALQSYGHPGLESPFLREGLYANDSTDLATALSANQFSETPFLHLPLEPSEEEVIGTDQRTRVADTFKIPNRWICAIDILVDNPRWGSVGETQFMPRARGTGILIGPRYVLTARHISNKQLIDVDGREKPFEVKGFMVSPARNGSNIDNPLGSVKSKAFQVPLPYKTRRRVRHGSTVIEIPFQQQDDYGLIILEKDLTFGTHSEMKGVLSYWGHDPAVAVIRRVEPSSIEGKEIAVIGYPGDTSGEDKYSGSKSEIERKRKIEYWQSHRSDEWASTQWKSVGTLKVEENLSYLFHTADTYKGQSGAPICFIADQKLNLVGVHTEYDNNSQRNKGMRVTRTMLKNLCAWINADAGYTMATTDDDALIVVQGGGGIDSSNVKDFHRHFVKDREDQNRSEDYFDATDFPSLTEGEVDDGGVERWGMVPSDNEDPKIDNPFLTAERPQSGGGWATRSAQTLVKEQTADEHSLNAEASPMGELVDIGEPSRQFDEGVLPNMAEEPLDTEVEGAPADSDASNITMPIADLIKLRDKSATFNEDIQRMVTDVLKRRTERPDGWYRPGDLIKMWSSRAEEFESGVPDQRIGDMIEMGHSENDITNEVFYQRNPGQRGHVLRRGTKPAAQWLAILKNEVRPATKRLLRLRVVDPVLLATFFSQYESENEIPISVTEEFLTRTPLLSMGRTLRDRILSTWQSGEAPLTLDRLYKCAQEVSGHPPTTMLLCHNVTKAFARGGVAIKWDRVKTNPDTYSDGKATWTPKVIHRAGNLNRKYSKKYAQELPSIYYQLFSDREFGVGDEGDWYHYYVAATMTAYGVADALTVRNTAPEREREELENRSGGWMNNAKGMVYPLLVKDRVLDMENKMSNPDLARERGYRGWVLANVMSFLEGGFYAETPKDVYYESRYHLSGAWAGLRTGGIKPGKNWMWYVPRFQSLSEQDLALGFQLQMKVQEVLDANGRAITP